MKLIIQIPCLDEERTLPTVLAELPREVEGFDAVEWLVIDDGSTDRTAEVARAGGVDHLVRLTNNKGLAAAFQAGLDAALKLGADVIVNTDADNQYRAAEIPRLVAPILEGRADMVVGDRQVEQIEHFSATKKALQRLGSWVVRRASDTDVPDTTSGFRAYNREAALQLVVVSNFTYTLEALIQAGQDAGRGRARADRDQPGRRASPGCSRAPATYVRRNALAIFRAYVLYEPLRVFTIAACAFAIGALLAWTPFVLDVILNGDSSGHVQSLILGAVLAVIAVQMFGLGVIGDTLAGQRVIAQRIFERVRRLELEAGVEPSHLEGRTRAVGESPADRARARAAEDDLPVDEVLAQRREAHRGPGGDQVVDPEPEVEDEEDAVLERPEERRGDRGLEQLAAERRRPGRGTPTAAGARS